MADKKITEERSHSSEGEPNSGANLVSESELLSIKLDKLYNQWTDKSNQIDQITNEFVFKMISLAEMIPAFNQQFLITAEEMLDKAKNDLQESKVRVGHLKARIAAMKGQTNPFHLIEEVEGLSSEVLTQLDTSFSRLDTGFDDIRAQFYGSDDNPKDFKSL